MNANSDREYIDNKVGDVRTSVDDLRTTVDDLRTTMNERFDALRMTMDARFAATDAKIDSIAPRVMSDFIKWGVGLFVTTIALNVALVSVVLHVALREPLPPPPVAAPVQPISTPAVIIQLTPQGATVLPAAPPAGKP